LIVSSAPGEKSVIYDWLVFVSAHGGQTVPEKEWSRHVTLKFLVPLKYFWDGLSWRLRIMYSGWRC